MKRECSEISSKNSKAYLVSREAYLVKEKPEDFSRERRFTLHARRFTFFLPRFTNCGFTLIEMLGVLAVLAILGGLLAPQFVKHLDVAAQVEEEMYLKDIGQGVELYMRENRSWPANLAALSPDYVTISSAQIGQNGAAFPRYFFVHPDMGSFSNATGIAGSDLPDTRFLLISNVKADASPTITNGTQFDTWWNTDTTTTPNVKIYRGHMGKMFHLVSVSAVGDGGSFRIDGTATSSGGGRITSQGNYHLVGTPIELDEADTFSAGNSEVDFTLTSDAGYQFDPDCTTGSQWNALGSTCTTS